MHIRIVPPHALLAAVVCCLSLAPPTLAGSVVFVDDDARPGGDGSVWTSAFRFLQDALQYANQPGSEVTEIRVAQGTYKPDRSTMNPNGSGDRAATFQLLSGVALHGGYAGIGAPDPDLIGDFPTVLSGDLAGNDGPNFNGYGENSFHILRATSLGVITAVRGFTIRDGNANSLTAPDDRGGGLLAGSSSVQIDDCIVEKNQSYSGAGMYSDGASSVVSVSDCSLIGNQALSWGGAIMALNGSITITNCSFDLNTAASSGGALRVDGTLTVVNSSFTNGSSLSGGAFATNGFGGLIQAFTGCIFQNNHVQVKGGAFSIDGNTNINASNCQFLANISEFQAGAVYAEHGQHMFSVCVFNNNSAGEGGAFYNVVNPTLVFNDCEFSDNFGQVGAVYNDGADIHTTYNNCLFAHNQSIAVYENRSKFEYRECTFDNNYGWTSFSHGAAVYVYDWSAYGTFRKCLFQNNTADGTGGALLLTGTNAQVIDCDFIGNTGTHYGGGLACDSGSPKIVNCRFFQNHTDGWGGGVFAFSGSTASVMNCLFVGNTATLGAGVAVSVSNISIRNSTIAYNSNPLAQGGGMGLVGSGTTLVLANSILWGNSAAGQMNQAAQIFRDAAISPLNISYSCVQGWSGSLGGPGNLGLVPMFADADGPDEQMGTIDDDFHLLTGSPCIDVADNNAVPLDATDLDEDGNTTEVTVLDLDHSLRFIDDPTASNGGAGSPPIVDMGPYESQTGFCLGDIAPEVHDGIINAADLLAIINSWGLCNQCVTDIAPLGGDGVVNCYDLMAVINAWGPCP